MCGCGYVPCRKDPLLLLCVTQTCHLAKDSTCAVADMAATRRGPGLERMDKLRLLRAGSVDLEITSLSKQEHESKHCYC